MVNLGIKKPRKRGFCALPSRSTRVRLYRLGLLLAVAGAQQFSHDAVVGHCAFPHTFFLVGFDPIGNRSRNIQNGFVEAESLVLGH